MTVSRVTPRKKKKTKIWLGTGERPNANPQAQGRKLKNSNKKPLKLQFEGNNSGHTVG